MSCWPVWGVPETVGTTVFNGGAAYASISLAAGYVPFSKLANVRSLVPVGVVAAPEIASRNPVIPVKLTQSTATSVTAQALERSRELVALLSNSSDSNSSDPFGDKDAPNDQSVIVRVAAIDVAGGCDALTDTTKSLVGTDRKVVGCARSCPVTLDVSQDVALDFGDPTCTHLDDCAELSTPSATP